MEVRFGKYKGFDSSALPVEYLEWCAENMRAVPPEIVSEVHARASYCVRSASAIYVIASKSITKSKPPQENPKKETRLEAAIRRATKRSSPEAASERRRKKSLDRNAQLKAGKQIVGEHYAAMREQWELAGGDASQCPFADDYLGPFIDWEGSEPVIRVNLEVMR